MPTVSSRMLDLNDIIVYTYKHFFFLVSYVGHSEATEAQKDGFEQANYLTLDVYARKDRSTPNPVFVSKFKFSYCILI